MLLMTVSSSAVAIEMHHESGHLILREVIPTTVVEPDHPYSREGNWEISTARWGVGCVAILPYDPPYSMAIGGQQSDELSLIVDAAAKVFGVLPAEEVDVTQMEMVLGSQRWGAEDLKSYGYRGAHGLEVKADEKLLEALTMAPTLKITRRGHLQLVIDLGGAGRAMQGLSECLSRTR
jgi:hypothetical protein